MPRYLYAIAPGHNVALVSLANIENISAFRKGHVALPPKSQPVDVFPVRRKTLSGKTWGGGVPDHQWTWDVLPVAALEYLEDTYLSGAAVASAPVTINTRRHDQGVYTRYNAYITLPQPSVDYAYRQGKVLGLTLTFTHLVAI